MESISSQQSPPTPQADTYAKTQKCDLVAHLVLQRLPKFAAGRYWQLHKVFGSAHAILNAPSALLRAYFTDDNAPLITELQQQGEKHTLYRQAEQELAWCEAQQIALITHADANYPALLLNTNLAPPLLYIKGDATCLNLPQLGIVGSRNPSPSGRDNSFHFARELARLGFAITSGLALGIDAAAHQGALASQGKTVAVMGTGIDQLYPRRNRGLAEQILAGGGALVSEFPIGTAAHPTHFPRRNRIISGLSMGVIVVEAALQSGSLITAKYALQQGREVFAIPGSIHNPQSRGCHQLIKEGATLVEQIDDLVEPLQGLMAFKWAEIPTMERPSDTLEMTRDEALVFTCIGYEPTNMETLQARSHLDAGTLLSILVGLEIKGVIQQQHGSYQRKAEPRRSYV